MHTYVIYSLLVLGVWGHGRLTVPATRKPTGYENDPVSGPNGTDFVCKNNPNARSGTNAQTFVTAGSSMDVQWDFSAAHVGDCSLYIGYGDAATAGFGDAKRAARFVKIANVFDCKAFNRQLYTVDLPSWLPAGPAVLRWEWAALHVHPNIEFYTQCADIIVSSQSSLTAADLPSYTVVGPNVLPSSANVGVGYRNAFNQNREQYMTGPPCAFPDQADSSANCDLTAQGTTGYVDVSDRILNGNPIPSPTPAPVDPVPSPTQAPVDPVTPAPVDPVTPAPVDPVTPAPVDPVTPAPVDPVTPAPVPSPTVGGTDAPATPSPTVGGTDAPAPTAEPTPAPTNDPQQCSNGGWATCGGSNHTGETCCPAGFHCADLNQWYSQCINYPCPQGWACWDQQNNTGRRRAENEPVPSFDNFSQFRDWCEAFNSQEGCRGSGLCRYRRGHRGQSGTCQAPRRLYCRTIKDLNVCEAVGCNVADNKCRGGQAFD